MLQFDNLLDKKNLVVYNIFVGAANISSVTERIIQMKFRRNKTAVFLASLLIAMTISGCKDKNNKQQSESVPDEILRQPFTFSFDEDTTVPGSAGNNAELNAQDPTAPKATTAEEQTNQGGSTVYVEVTDASGQTVTQYVPVTDASGVQATENDGEPKTESVAVTEAVSSVPDSTGESAQNGTQSENTTNPPSTEKITNYKTGKTYWFDISKGEDFVFNGDFVSMTFKVNENVPDGIYDIEIVKPDFANYAGETVKPKNSVNARIYVNTDGASTKDYDDGFSIYGQEVSCRAGDEVTVNFRLSNNPGVCAVIFKFRYDADVLELKDCSPVGEYAEIQTK